MSSRLKNSLPDPSDEIKLHETNDHTEVPKGKAGKAKGEGAGTPRGRGGRGNRTAQDAIGSTSGKRATTGTEKPNKPNKTQQTEIPNLKNTRI